MELTAIDRVRHHQKLFRPFLFGVLATLTAQLRTVYGMICTHTSALVRIQNNKRRGNRRQHSRCGRFAFANHSTSGHAERCVRVVWSELRAHVLQRAHSYRAFAQPHSNTVFLSERHRPRASAAEPSIGSSRDRRGASSDCSIDAKFTLRWRSSASRCCDPSRFAHYVVPLTTR